MGLTVPLKWQTSMAGNGMHDYLRDSSSPHSKDKATLSAPLNLTFLKPQGRIDPTKASMGALRKEKR